MSFAGITKERDFLWRIETRREREKERFCGGSASALDSGPRSRFAIQMPNDWEDRLQKLEAHITHLERQYDELNEVVIKQGRVLDRLKKELGKTSRAVETIELERIRANNAKPPHAEGR